MTSYFIDTVILTFIIITSPVNLNAFEENFSIKTNDLSLISEEENLLPQIEPCMIDCMATDLTSTRLEKLTPSSIEDIDIEEASQIEVEPITEIPTPAKVVQPKLLTDFPDLGGILDFSNHRNISNTCFILTNPKSGTHLLTYSIMKITGRPVRGRLPLWHFLYDPSCFEPENIMNYPLDFTKPTIYIGHEYFTLMKISKDKNKLIFINRDYKENLLSQIITSKNLFPAQNYQEILEDLFKEEITQEGPVFKEFLYRLQVFDKWNPSCRCLVEFQDLVKHPECFIPKVMEFIEDTSEYQNFIENYDSFKKELLTQYRFRDNGTGSESNLKFFRQFISKETLHEVDDYISTTYPVLWEQYLQKFQEQD